jgi:hypothetical protein
MFPASIVCGLRSMTACAASGVFEPLRDPVYFARVELDAELGTISWPNGADIAPETLHVWIASGRQNVSA